MLHINFNCNIISEFLGYYWRRAQTCWETFSTGCYLSEVLLSLQKLLLASSWVGQKLVPALHQGSMTSFDGFRLDMLGCQQLVLESCNVGDALLLEGLETGIKRLLQTDTKKRRCSQQKEQHGTEERWSSVSEDGVPAWWAESAQRTGLCHNHQSSGCSLSHLNTKHMHRFRNDGSS